MVEFPLLVPEIQVRISAFHCTTCLKIQDTVDEVDKKLCICDVTVIFYCYVLILIECQISDVFSYNLLTKLHPDFEKV